MKCAWWCCTGEYPEHDPACEVGRLIESQQGGRGMKCPFCGSELEHVDVFGRIAAHQDGKITGDIYKCPRGAEQDGSCDSEVFSVAGSFYTRRDDGDELREG